VLITGSLEIAWLPPLITQSGNARIQVRTLFHLRSSPRFSTFRRGPSPAPWRRSPLGNPHYWLDPDNGRRLARGCIWRLYPPDVAYFPARFQDFDKRLSAAEQSGKQKMGYKGGSVIITSFPNFAKALHLNVIGYIEPRPGIPRPQAYNEEIGF